MSALEKPIQTPDQTSEPAVAGSFFKESNGPNPNVIPKGYRYETTFSLFNGSNLLASPQERYRHDQLMGLHELFKQHHPDNIIQVVSGVTPLEDLKVEQLEDRESDADNRAYSPDLFSGGRIAVFVRQEKLSRRERFKKFGRRLLQTVSSKD